MLHAPIDPTQLYLFGEGNNAYSYSFLGAHPWKKDGRDGWRFSVWAPEALRASVVGDFNNWEPDVHPMKVLEGGVWEAFVPDLKVYDLYKFAFETQEGWIFKADPYAFFAENKPDTASKLYDLQRCHDWQDQQWMHTRKKHNALRSPMSIYEMHLGTWRRDGEGKYYTYRRIADELIPYVKDMGYTHIQIMPVMEHPYDLSWGYQVTGYYAATSRFGVPGDFMELVDRAHQAGIGVLLDWVPAHFPRDAHGLRRFDGTPLYEHADPRRGENRLWGTCMFDYSKGGVRSFMISNAIFWLDQFHVDGLRVDAVSYMLHHDYAREDGDWLPNEHGGNDNIEAVAFLQRTNQLVYREFPGIIMSAEEATAYPEVTTPVHTGGLGFGFKWKMGWMHDTLNYMKTDALFRKGVHHKITFSMDYAFNENFILPLSHDEVVHGKLSLINRMPGDIWRKFAQLRLLYGYMFAHPGKKLMFMGGEFGQFIEWKEEEPLDWFLLDYENHAAVQKCVRDLNHLYQKHGALWSKDDSWDGFAWVDPDDTEQSIFSFLRRDGDEVLLVVLNFTPAYYPAYDFPMKYGGVVREIFNTDDVAYCGSGKGNAQPIQIEKRPYKGKGYTLTIEVPPLAAVYFKYDIHKGAIREEDISKRTPIEQRHQRKGERPS